MRAALEGLKGVKKANVSFNEKRAVVTYDPNQVSPDEMIRAVDRAGFQARLVTKR